jgi:hypothetical protein
MSMHRDLPSALTDAPMPLSFSARSIVVTTLVQADAGRVIRIKQVARMACDWIDRRLSKQEQYRYVFKLVSIISFNFLDRKTLFRRRGLSFSESGRICLSVWSSSVRRQIYGEMCCTNKSFKKNRGDFSFFKLFCGYKLLK